MEKCFVRRIYDNFFFPLNRRVVTAMRPVETNFLTVEQGIEFSIQNEVLGYSATHSVPLP